MSKRPDYKYNEGEALVELEKYSKKSVFVLVSALIVAPAAANARHAGVE